MSVDRRQGTRHPHELNVQVRYRKRSFPCAQAGNLSTDGMLLALRNVTLPVGTMVELELETQGAAWLVEGIIVHNQDGGFGIMFRESMPEPFRELIFPRRDAIPLRRNDAAHPPPATR